MKKLLIVSAIGILSSCGDSFPTACDCYGHYHEDTSIDQDFYEYNNPGKVKNIPVRKVEGFVTSCAEKFGSAEAKRVKGTDEFRRQMRLSLKDKCEE